MRYPPNFGQGGGFGPAPINMPYPYPHQMPIPIPQPVSVTYHYDDGSWSGPQMIPNDIPISIGYSVLNPDASEFVPSYWKPLDQPYDGTMMNGGGGGIMYEESYTYAEDNTPYVLSYSGATPTPLYDGGQELPNPLYPMPPPPSGQEHDAAGNSQTYPKAPSNVEHQVDNVMTTTATKEATVEPCKHTCCNHKEPLAKDEAPAAAVVETPKKASIPDDDTKKDTEKCEVIPIQVVPVKCFPIYGFIGYHYGLPDPPLPEPQKLVKITSSKDNQSRLVIHSAPAVQVQAPPPTSKAATPKEHVEQTSSRIPNFSAMPLPVLPVPQVHAMVPDNYKSKVTPSKNGCNPELYTRFPPGYVRIDPNLTKNLHYRNAAAKVLQKSGK